MKIEKKDEENEGAFKCAACGELVKPLTFEEDMCNKADFALDLTYEERLFLSDVLLGYQAMLQHSRQTMFGDAAAAVTEQMDKIASLNKKILNVTTKNSEFIDLLCNCNQNLRKD